MIRNNFSGHPFFSIWRLPIHGLIALILVISMPLMAGAVGQAVRLRNTVIDTSSTVLSFQQSGKAAYKLSPDVAALLATGKEPQPINLIIQFTSPIREEWKKQKKNGVTSEQITNER